MLNLPTFDDVQAAASRLKGHAHRTPVLTSRTMDAQLGASLFFKCENFQRMGAFKFRGGFNALSTLTPDDAPIAVPFPSTVTFSGPAFSEPTLIAFAYAFEQATRHRVPPTSTPALPGDTVRRRR